MSLLATSLLNLFRGQLVVILRCNHCGIDCDRLALKTTGSHNRRLDLTSGRSLVTILHHAEPTAIVRTLMLAYKRFFEAQICLKSDSKLDSREQKQVPKYDHEHGVRLKILFHLLPTHGSLN